MGRERLPTTKTNYKTLVKGGGTMLRKMLALLAAMFVFASCSSWPPKCDSKEVVKLAKQVYPISLMDAVGATTLLNWYAIQTWDYNTAWALQDEIERVVRGSIIEFKVIEAKESDGVRYCTALVVLEGGAGQPDLRTAFHYTVKALGKEYFEVRGQRVDIYQDFYDFD